MYMIVYTAVGDGRLKLSALYTGKKLRECGKAILLEGGVELSDKLIQS